MELIVGRRCRCSVAAWRLLRRLHRFKSIEHHPIDCFNRIHLYGLTFDWIRIAMDWLASANGIRSIEKRSPIRCWDFFNFSISTFLRLLRLLRLLREDDTSTEQEMKWKRLELSSQKSKEVDKGEEEGRNKKKKMAVVRGNWQWRQGSTWSGPVVSAWPHDAPLMKMLQSLNRLTISFL